MTHKPAVVIREEDIHSFLAVTFAFEQSEGKVADHCTCQLTVTSYASKISVPVTMAELKIIFNGGFRPIILHHQENKESLKNVHTKVALSEGPSTNDALPSTKVSKRDSRHSVFKGSEDLTFTAGHSRVFEFTLPLREAGPARARSATFSMASDLFDLDYVVDFDRTIIPDTWWFQRKSKRRLVRIDPHEVNILPKPPKMEIRFVEVQDQYYTDEAISLQMEITNGEDEDSVATLAVHISGEQAPRLGLRFSKDTNSIAADVEKSDSIPEASLGIMQVAKSTFGMIDIPASNFPVAYDLIVDLSYHLVSDPDTPINRTMTMRLYVVSPFEANYDFSPRLDPTPWPSFFAHEELSPTDPSVPIEVGHQTATGLGQKWCLTARYASFALSPLYVRSINLDTIALNGGIICSTTRYPDSAPAPSAPTSIAPNTIQETQFSVSTRKISLDDRRSASLDLSLLITWSRTPSGPAHTTTLPVPRLLVASSEPRVLASIVATAPPAKPASEADTESDSPAALMPGLVDLVYSIENPSMHFLTFGVAMSPSEEFAFSGPKLSSLQLTPLSRRAVRFGLLPVPKRRESADADGDAGGRWIRVVFVVRDRYFQKVLRVAPGEGMRADKEGVLIWVPFEE